MVQDQTGFVSKLVDGIDNVVGGLIDVNMNAESVRLSSLHVRQQLAIQALSITNQSYQNILALCRH